MKTNRIKVSKNVDNISIILLICALLISLASIASLKHTRRELRRVQDSSSIEISNLSFSLNNALSLENLSLEALYRNTLYTKQLDMDVTLENSSNKTIVFFRIHEDICFPCSKNIFNSMQLKVLSRPDLNLVIFSSFQDNALLMNSLSEIGLNNIQYFNIPQAKGFISCDSANKPYLFTIMRNSVSSIFFLDESKHSLIDEYLNMIERFNQIYLHNH